MLAQLNLDTIQQKAFGKAMPANIGTFITSSRILEYVFAGAAIALLIYLILGGFQLMTSQGDPKAAQGAQAKITNALIGFVIIIFAFSIVQIFSRIFGLGFTSFGLIFK
jgi:small-conductance mechanosensitive channel